MTRKELSQVYYLNKELKMWEQKLTELCTKSLVGSKEISDMPFSNTGEVSDITFEYISEIMEIQADIEVFKLNIIKKINDVHKYMRTIDDPFLKMIIEYRCIQCMTWRQVADMIGSGTSEDSIRMYFNRKFPK